VLLLLVVAAVRIVVVLGVVVVVVVVLGGGDGCHPVVMKDVRVVVVVSEGAFRIVQVISTSSHVIRSLK
jgi:hypothetical protein